MAYQRKTRRRQQKKTQNKSKRGGYVWDTKPKKTRSSTIKSRSSASKKTKSAYSILPNVIN